MRTSLLARLIAILAVLALLAAACGDDSTTDAGDDPVDDGTTVDGDGDGDAGGGDDNTPDRGDGDGIGSDDDDDGDDGDDGDPGDGTGAGDGDDMDDGGDMGDGDPPPGDVATYCDLAVQADVAGDAFEPGTATPADTEDYWRTQLALIEQGRAAAPAEIREDFEALYAVWSEMTAVLEAAGWDFSAAIEELEAIISDPTTAATLERLDLFDFEVCGIDLDDDGSDGGDDDQAGFNDSPYCQAAFALSEDDSTIPFGGPPEELQAYYDDVLAALVELHDLAPDELKPDIDVIGEGISTIYVLLESYGFDMSAAIDDFEALVDDPEFFEPMDAASARLEAYDAEVCGIII